MGVYHYSDLRLEDYLATPGTAAALAARGLPVDIVAPGEVMDLVRDGGVGVVVNTATCGHRSGRGGFALRRAAFELNVPVLTSLDSARALIEAFAAEPESDLAPLSR